MKETVLKKEFNERDLKRIRNLIGKRQNDKVSTSIGYTKKEEKHFEGHIWEENGKQWTIQNGIKRTVNKLNIVSVPLLCPKCSKPMKNKFDKQMYDIHGMCLYCVTEMETELKLKGEYEEYERNMIKQNAQYTLESLTVGLDEFLDDIINETYAMEDGTIQNWSGKGLDKEETKKHVVKKLNKLKSAIED